MIGGGIGRVRASHPAAPVQNTARTISLAVIFLLLLLISWTVLRESHLVLKQWISQLQLAVKA